MENKESFWVVFHSAWGEDRGGAEVRQDYDKKAWLYVQTKMEVYFEKQEAIRLSVANDPKEHYTQECTCQNFRKGLVANDCHAHNENPVHFAGDYSEACDCYSKL